VRKSVAVLTAAVALTVSGCGVTNMSSAGTRPECTTKGHPGSPATLLMAQSVPTATFIPCVALLPAGWGVTGFAARNGRSSFWLTSDRAGNHAVEVVLANSCDFAGASQVPTDEPGTVRYERVTGLTKGYSGARYYVFAGGCTSYQFALKGDTIAEPVNEASLALSFVPRSQLADRVRDESHGRLHLDP
jgi:hypothetical protein